ncbi:hypothetical protein GCM10023100_00110 [Actinocorallia cavernae]|uniref:Uncharacterized protein n=2 Tax=Actinomycetes TaxID=1760 RepID=A0ABN3L5W0_9ACTN
MLITRIQHTSRNPAANPRAEAAAPPWRQCSAALEPETPSPPRHLLPEPINATDSADSHLTVLLLNSGRLSDPYSES